MTFISSKDILSTNIFLNSSGASSKKARNEFQAYAYRLASDLNDLENLKIYMRLAKNVERNLMEEAYSYVIDSQTQQKGRLFLWKLKEIRKSIQENLDMKNYSYEFVLRQVRNARNYLSLDITQKLERDFDDQKKHFVFGSIVKNSSDKKDVNRLLLIGSQSRKFYTLISSLGVRCDILEISNKIANSQKEFFLTELKSREFKIYNKEFLKKTFRHKYDFIIFDSFWNFVPIDSEIKFLKKVRAICNPGCRLIFSFRHSLIDKEEWRKFSYENQNLFFFYKFSTKKHIQSLVEKFSMKLLEFEQFQDMEYRLLEYNID